MIYPLLLGLKTEKVNQDDCGGQLEAADKLFEQ